MACPYSHPRSLIKKGLTKVIIIKTLTQPKPPALIRTTNSILIINTTYCSPDFTLLSSKWHPPPTQISNPNFLILIVMISVNITHVYVFFFMKVINVIKPKGKQLLGLNWVALCKKLITFFFLLHFILICALCKK